MDRDDQQALKAAYMAGATAKETGSFEDWLAAHPGATGRRIEIHRGNHASVERILSRETKVRVFVAGSFDQEELAEIVAALRNEGRLDGRPLLDASELEDLRKVRNYFREVAGPSLIGVSGGVVDWNSAAKQVLEKVLVIHALGKV